MYIAQKQALVVTAMLLAAALSHSSSQEKHTIRIGVEGAYPPGRQ